MSPARKKPSAVGDVLAGLLKDSGLAERVEQAGVIPEWPTLVGPQIAAVTAPTSVTADGTLWVQVTTHAWMNELSLMKPQLLKALNGRPGSAKIRDIRWQLLRT